MLESSRNYVAIPPGMTIKELLQDRGISQKEFAVRIGASEKHVSKLIKAASIEILLDALGPKCFVIISIHIKESQDISIPPSSAIQSS